MNWQADVRRFADATRDPVTAQYAIMLLSWGCDVAQELPEHVVGLAGNAWKLVWRLYSGEFASVQEDVPPDDFTDETSELETQKLNELQRQTFDGVQELLKRVPKETNRLALDFIGVDAFLHVTFGKYPILPLPLNEQATHVLRFMIERCKLDGKDLAGATYEEIIEYLLEVAKTQEFIEPPKPGRDHKAIKKSVDRHKVAISDKLLEAFPVLKRRTIFATSVPKGIVFYRVPR